MLVLTALVLLAGLAASLTATPAGAGEERRGLERDVPAASFSETSTAASGADGARNEDAPVLSIDSPSVIEGEGGGIALLAYTVSLAPASSERVTVRYRVAGGTATAGVDYEPLSAGTLVFAAGARSARIQIVVLGDDIVEPDETVEVVLSAPTGGARIGQGSGTGTVLRDAGRPSVTVRAPAVKEGASGATATPRFVATLTRPPGYTHAVTFDFEVREIGASPTARPVEKGVLAFAQPNETVATVRFSVEGDSRPEHDRRFAMFLTNPHVVGFGKRPEIERERGTGILGGTVTVEDDDPIDRKRGLAYALSSVGREVSAGIVDAIWERAESQRTGPEGIFAMGGGRVIEAGAFSGGNGHRAAREAAGLPGIRAAALQEGIEVMAGGRQMEARTDAWRQWANPPRGAGLLEGTRFTLSTGDEVPGKLAFWGQGRVASYASKIGDGEYGEFSSKGGHSAGYLGIEYSRGGYSLFGVAVSRSVTKADYTFAGAPLGNGGANTSLTSVTPYVHWVSAAEFEVWAAASTGTGSAQVEDGLGKVKAGVDMQMLAAGVLLGETKMGGYRVAAKADTYTATVSSDAAEGSERLGAAKAKSSRTRVAVEAASWGEVEGGGITTLRFDVGARQDGGSAESGFGMDIGVKAGFANPGSGFEVTGRGEIFLFHAQKGFRQWSAGLGLAYAPEAGGRGLQISLGPTWNGPLPDLETVAERRFAGQRISQGGGTAVQGRLAYGVEALQGRALMTAYSKIEEGGERERTRLLRLGAEMRQLGTGFGGFRIEAYGQREEKENAPPEHAVMLEARFEH